MEVSLPAVVVDIFNGYLYTSIPLYSANEVDQMLLYLLPPKWSLFWLCEEHPDLRITKHKFFTQIIISSVILYLSLLSVATMGVHTAAQLP